MTRYRVYLETIASAGIDVEADNQYEAEEKALAEAPMELCAFCSREVSIGDWDIDEVENEDEDEL